MAAEEMPCDSGVLRGKTHGPELISFKSAAFITGNKLKSGHTQAGIFNETSPVNHICLLFDLNIRF